MINAFAVRFNLERGGSEDISKLKAFAHRVFEIVGWHVELYVDSKELPDLYDALIELPAVSIDHFGLSKSGLSLLIQLAEKIFVLKLQVLVALIAMYQAHS